MRAIKQRQLDVLTGGCSRQQIEALKNETEFVVADVRQLIAVEHGNIRLVQNVATESRPIETTKNVHERRFSRTARAHQRDELAALNLERNAAHRMNIDVAGMIRLVHVDQFDDFSVLHVDLASASTR